MDDLIERLRMDPASDALELEAADRITSLQQENERLWEALADARGNIEFARNSITHPNGRRAHFVDSHDQIKVDTLNEAIAELDAALRGEG